MESFKKFYTDSINEASGDMYQMTVKRKGKVIGTKKISRKDAEEAIKSVHSKYLSATGGYDGSIETLDNKGAVVFSVEDRTLSFVKAS